MSQLNICKERSTIQELNLVNCARLPQPKSLKPGAKISLCEEKVRSNLIHKDPEFRKGKHVVYGFDTELYGPTAFASNRHNEEQALLARVLADTVQPITGCSPLCTKKSHDPLCQRFDDGIISLPACIRWCKMNHKQLFPAMNCVQSVTWPEYLRRSNASPSVKRILQMTYLRMVSEGYDEHSVLSPNLLYQWTTRSSFVKVENNLYRTPCGEKDKAPRLIQGAQPEFIVLVGPYIMALQDVLKRRWCVKKSNKVFTSGVSAEDSAEFISNADGNILEDDLGKFDCSIRKQWCEYEVWLVQQFGAPRAVVDLMTANIKTHGMTLHGWMYKCEGTRKSGDPYTSLMNSVINALSHEYLYCFWTKCTVAQSKKRLKMLVQGDDNLMRHKERKKFDWRNGMAALGFDSESIYRGSLHEAEFCSNRLYEVDGNFIFGPKPGKVLAKFGYIVNPPKHVTRESMMRGVAIGLQKLTHHIPPIRAVVDRVLELTRGHEAYFEQKFEDHVMKTRGTYESTPEVMATLDAVYHWDYCIQRSFEKSLSQMTLGDVYPSVFPQLLFDVDTSGPQSLGA